MLFRKTHLETNFADAGDLALAWTRMSRSVAWDIVTAFPDKPWDWKELTRHFSWEVIAANQGRSWDPEVLKRKFMSDVDAAKVRKYLE